MKKYFSLVCSALVVMASSAQSSYLQLPQKGISRALASDGAASPMYCPPISSMYVGCTSAYTMPEEALQVQPARVSLEWENSSDAPASSWVCGDLPVESASAGYLVLNFPCPASSPNEVYQAPVIEADGVSYAQPQDILVCGSTQIDGLTYGMLPFDVVSDGLMAYTADYKGNQVPIFGYGKGVDDYWRLYTAGGDEQNLSHIGYAHVTGIINGVIPTAQPLVVHGVWLPAVASVSDDAQFTCSIYSLDSDGAFDRLVASASIKGSDLVRVGEFEGMPLYSLPFAFDAPVVLDAEGTEGDFYAVMVSGFHDAGVEYFAPLMQKTPNAFELCFGFYQIALEYNGEQFDGLSFVASHKNEGEDMYCSFAINLDAEYPWLECDDADLSLVDGRCTAKLNSYYPASDLSVTLIDGSSLPDWLTVEASGQYSDAALSFYTSAESPAMAAVDVKVSGVGVSTLLHIKSADSISDIITTEASTTGIYDFLGRRVASSHHCPGFYIERHSDGSVRKVLY